MTIASESFPMPKLKPVTSLSLLLSDVTIAVILTMLLITWAPQFAALGSKGFFLLFVLTSGFVALITVVSLSFTKPNAAANRVIAARDLAIHLREKALNEHTIVTMSHPNGRVAAVNQNFVDILGYDVDEIVGRKSETYFWDCDEGEFERVREIVSSGRTWKGSQRLRTKDGRRLAFETTILPRFDDTGRFENSISIRTDVSRAKAQGAEEGRNAVIEALPDEVYLYDPETYRLSYANENARRRLRLDLENLQRFSILDLLNADEKRRFRDHIAPILSGEAPRAHLEVDHVTGPAEILTHLDETPDGTRVLVSVVRDTSERKKAEQIRLSSVATVSHELRTPLTSIKGALRLLESGVAGELGPDAARMVTVARRNSDRLLTIVNDILDLEKMASGETTFQKKEIDLGALLCEAAEANAAFAAECGVRFETERPEEPALVWGDPDRLMQVMSNLMSNAAKFSPDGASIRLGIEDREDVWRVFVSDQGPGIPEAARKTLFDNFTQVADMAGKHHQGTGLGLSICREIVSRHRGHIAFETEVGNGSTFYFELGKLDAKAASASARQISVA